MSANYRGSSTRSQGQSGYYHHDNRRGGQSHGRANNSSQFYRGKRGRDWKHGGRGAGASDVSRVHIDQDGDVMMGDDHNDSSKRFNPYSIQARRIKSKQYQRGGGRSGHSHGRDYLNNYSGRPDQWHRVQLLSSRHFNKETLLKVISGECPVPLNPINFHYEGTSVVFYVKDMSAAIAIKKMNNAIEIGDNFRLKTTVRPVNKIPVNVNEDIYLLIKNCIMRRYNLDNYALDLSSFHADSGLLLQNYILHLNLSSIMQAVAKAVNEVIPQIDCLDLSGNDLSHLDFFNQSSIRNKIKHLRVLNANDNKIIHLSQLELISTCPLEELNLINGFASRPNQSRNQTVYVETIRKHFPTILKLDGEMLPPQIGFDVERPANLPPTKDSYFANDQGRQIAVTFFEQYFNFYDSNRDALLDAYHIDSVFSLVTVKNDSRSTHSPSYLHSSRNLLRVTEAERRNKLLFRGNQEIIKTLNKLPKTQHDATSFSLDVTSANENFISVFISGVYKEMEAAKHEHVRSFTRTIIIIPCDGGFKVTNEMLLIMPPSYEQRKKAFKSVENVPAGAAPIASVDTDEVKQQMILSFSQQSGMIPEWSLRCLQEWNWDFDKAAQAFTEINAKGGIPREAFASMDAA